MKTLFASLYLLCCLLLVGSATAAPLLTTRAEPELAIVGTWKANMTLPGMVNVLHPTFKADGTYVMVVANITGVLVQKGTYTYEDKVLTMTPDGGYAEAGIVKVVNKNEFIYKKGTRQLTFRRQ